MARRNDNLRLNVAIIGSRGYPSSYGGFETLVRHLAPYLTDAGCDVTVYCRGSEDSRGSSNIDDITCVQTFGIEGKATSTLSFGLTAALDSRRRHPDVALVLNVANGFFLPILRRAGVGTVVNVDGIEWERGKWSRMGKAVFLAGARMTARHADTIVVDSHVIGDIWRSKFGVDSTYIPYGAPVVRDVGHDRLDRIGVEPGAYVLVVARLVPENNVGLFLDALRVLDFGLPAVIVGSAGTPSPLEDEVRSAAAEHPELRWLGQVHDQELLTQLWGHCGAYFHGHSVGGTNPSLLQAMGCGSPTVAVDTPFNREVLGPDARLCPAEPEEIAARLKTVVGDPALRSRLAAEGRSTVERRYRWDDVCRGYASALSSVASPVGLAPALGFMPAAAPLHSQSA